MQDKWEEYQHQRSEPHYYFRLWDDNNKRMVDSEWWRDFDEIDKFAKRITYSYYPPG